ncbi:uncharacterized protein ACRADG_005199 [Cochliomyia hominivorax]
MNFKNNFVKYLYLIGIILLQINYSYTQESKTISCIQCEGSGTECNENVAAKECKKENTVFTKCFTQIDTSGKIIRGCATQEFEGTCKDANCKLSDSGKNNETICKKCDASDPKCSQTDMNTNDMQYSEICSDGITECLLKVDDNKLIVRGCNTGKISCSDNTTCKTCKGTNCNTGIFPDKRINCYQCSGSSCLDTTNLTSKPCLKYVSNDKCYTLGKSETEMIRGCQSDGDNNQCSTTNDSCLFCSADNCNNLKYKYDQKLKCHHCESNDPTNDCFKEQTGKEFKNCEKQILYDAEPYCYSRVDDSGAIKRGCLHDDDKVTIDNCKDNDDVCIKCNNADGCNSKAMSHEFTCIVCRSDLDQQCFNDADKIAGKECRTSPSSPQEGCFHGIWNGVAIRGCMVDLTIPNQEICKDKNNYQCNACYTKNCNKERSGAVKNVLQFSIILITFMIFWIFK